jgi:hypothetical protein
MNFLARVLLVIAATIAASCGGDSGGSGGTPASPSTVATLVGTWKATKAEYVSTANSSVRVEVVAQGTTLTLTLESAGTYTERIVDPGQEGQTTTGTWSATQDIMTLKPTGVTWDIQFDMTLSGTTLTLNGGHVSFDVNGDGRDEETLANLTLVKQ